METDHTPPEANLRVTIPIQTCDYRIVTDDPDNWQVVANRQISKGERITSTGSTSYVHLGSAAGMEITIAGSGESKFVSAIQHAVPGDESCVPEVLELPWCLMNHSCEPNSLDALESTDTGDLVLTATRTIKAGEQITYDYALEQFQYRSPFECGCGATSCRGLISGFNGLSKAEQAEKLNVASSYVRERYQRESILEKAHLSPSGQHLLLDYWDCDRSLLNDAKELTRILEHAAAAAGATVISTQSHSFETQGVTAITLLAESHISIHTWPESGYASVDIYTCGTCDPHLSHQVMIEELSVGHVKSINITRGLAGESRQLSSSDSKPPSRAGLEADKTWFTEGTVPGERHGHVNHGFHISELVHQQQTPFQECLIFDNPVYGRVLVLDGLVQLTTFDEHIYHEMLVHPPMFAHPQPRRVAIIGGGDGGTLREVLRHDPQEVVMIDIDEQFVRIAEQHLPSLSAGSFDDARVTLLFEDAMLALKRYENEFDVVIIDCNDAVGPAEPLFEEPFYKLVARALRADGTCSVQGGPALDSAFLLQVQQRMANCLGQTIGHRLTIPSYHCGDYIFFVASNGQNPAGPDREALAKLQATRGIATRYWSPDQHHASQALPKDSAL